MTMKGLKLSFAVIVIIGALLAAVAFIVLGENVGIALCRLHADPARQADCAFEKIGNILARGDDGGAVEAFRFAYRTMPNSSFGKDCHNAIHQVGDIAYFSVLYVDQDLSRFSYPVSTLLCGGGFYHGIFEHLVQDNPSVENIERVCGYFSKRPEAHMKEISITCYHAAGHGLIRDHSEKVPRSQWGDPVSFIRAPLDQCEALKDVSDTQRYACRTGVLSIFLQMYWSRTYGFGFTSDEDSLEPCLSLPKDAQEPCVDMRLLGIMQFSEDYARGLKLCDTLSQQLYEACLHGMVTGLATNGMTQRSLALELALCGDPSVLARKATSTCYIDVTRRMPRSYPVEGLSFWCEDFPPEFRALCTVRMEKANPR